MRIKPELDVALKAIESDKYEKAEGVLRIGDNCFCILGALCEEFRLQTEDGEWIINRNGEFAFVIDNQRFTIEAPLEVKCHFGIFEVLKSSDLMTLNDKTEKTLPKIARMIRKAVEKADSTP